jgi:ABC-2 type transport system permease protein
VRRIDYFLGKLGVIAWFLGMVLVVPSLIAYAAGMFFSLDLSIIPDTFPLLLSVVAYGAIVTVSAGLMILALSSLSRNSRYIGLFWLAAWFVSSIVGTMLDSIDRAERRHAHWQKTYAVTNAAQRRGGMNAEQQRKAQQEWFNAMAKAEKEFHEEEVERAKTNWRPLLSYTANLSRLGEGLMGTNAAFEKITENMEGSMRAQFLQSQQGPHFPWYWSAGLLAAFLGFSVCILNFRVKSLDRLK